MRHVALWEHACRGVIMSVKYRLLSVKFTYYFFCYSLNNIDLAWNNYDDELSPS